MNGIEKLLHLRTQILIVEPVHEKHRHCEKYKSKRSEKRNPGSVPYGVKSQGQRIQNHNRHCSGPQQTVGCKTEKYRKRHCRHGKSACFSYSCADDFSEAEIPQNYGIKPPHRPCGNSGSVQFRKDRGIVGIIKVKEHGSNRVKTENSLSKPQCSVTHPRQYEVINQCKEQYAEKRPG